MNFRRGLLRLWWVLAATWIVVACFTLSEGIHNNLWPLSYEVTRPSGEKKTLFFARNFLFLKLEYQNYLLDHAGESTAAFPEGFPNTFEPKPLEAIMSFLFLALLLPPLALLGFGYLIGWIISGFRMDHAA